MKNKILLALVPFLLGAPSGCTMVQNDPWAGWLQPVAEPVLADPDPVTMRLADAAERAAKALEVMSLVEQARTPVDTTPPPVANAPEELRQVVTVTWVGPVDKIAALLADVAGYSFNPIGQPPAVPVIVTVEVIERPVIEVLRSIGLQVGRVADISVNAETRVVEVRYAPKTGL